MRLPRTITAVPVILIILMPCIYCLYFQAKHQMIRWEMEERLESDGLQTIIIPVKDFRWYEEGREIVVNGTMFDVRSIEQNNDKYIVTGLFDEEETELHIAMGRLQEEQGTAAPDASLIPQMLSQTLIQTGTEIVVQFFQPASVESRMICTDETLYNTILSIQTPPPRG
jgi:hypothetical protein